MQYLEKFIGFGIDPLTAQSRYVLVKQICGMEMMLWMRSIELCKCKANSYATLWMPKPLAYEVCTHVAYSGEHHTWPFLSFMFYVVFFSSSMG